MTTPRRGALWEGAPPDHWRRAWRIPELHIFDRISSTNDVIREAGTTGSPAGTTAIADFQAGGRGRLGRPWLAPPGSALLISTLLRPGASGALEAAGALPIRVGLALAEALRTVAGIAVALKWPNDVLVPSGKVAGILCEAAGDFVVVGIGVNVSQEQTDFPPELRAAATSLRLATGQRISRARLAGEILFQLEHLRESPHRPLEAAELVRFAVVDALAGREVSLDGRAAGVAAGIDPLGALRVADGAEVRFVRAGTVRTAP